MISHGPARKIKLMLTRIPHCDLVWCFGGYVGLNGCFSYFGESFCFLSFYLFFFFLLVFHGSFILEAIFSSSFLSVFLSQFPKEQSDAQVLQYIIVLLLLLISSSPSLLKVLGDWAGWGGTWCRWQRRLTRWWAASVRGGQWHGGYKTRTSSSSYPGPMPPYGQQA